MIEEVHEATAEVVDALRGLLPQLSASATALDEELVRHLVESETTHLLVARDPLREIVGALTLVVFTIPTGTRARIEDVIVDSRARGRGFGEGLTRAALRLAAEMGARTVDLTSQPSREAANRMYQRIGFGERETNVYRYTF